jgi:GNAT superfamily N-acetyltransferase
MMETLAIRPAVGQDAAVAAEIYVVSSNAAFSAWQAPRELTDEHIARWATDLVRPRYHWWVADLDSAPVGVAGIGPSRDPVAEEIGELDTIAVLPTHWRRGLGRALMARVNEQLDRDGYERAMLWTWADYPAAAAFYPAMGWTRGDQYRDEGRQVSYWRSSGHGGDNLAR